MWCVKTTAHKKPLINISSYQSLWTKGIRILETVHNFCIDLPCVLLWLLETSLNWFTCSLVQTLFKSPNQAESTHCCYWWAWYAAFSCTTTFPHVSLHDHKYWLEVYFWELGEEILSCLWEIWKLSGMGEKKTKKKDKLRQTSWFNKKTHFCILAFP